MHGRPRQNKIGICVSIGFYQEATFDDSAGHGMSEDGMWHDDNPDASASKPCERSRSWSQTQGCRLHAERKSQHAANESQFDQLAGC